MSTGVIPADVARFIEEKIDSVAQMEALLLLRSDPRKEWRGDDLAKRLYIGENHTAEILIRLHADGLLVTKGSNPSRYRYKPSSRGLRRIVDRLADVYTRDLVEVTSLIHSKPKTKVQAFADAFKLQKDE